MLWFGPSWDAPVNESCAEGPPPIGALCSVCEVAFVEGDHGLILPMAGAEAMFVAYHLRCFLADVLGPGEIADLTP